jgi:hypothetical protein
MGSIRQSNRNNGVTANHRLCALAGSWASRASSKADCFIASWICAKIAPLALPGTSRASEQILAAPARDKDLDEQSVEAPGGKAAEA